VGAEGLDEVGERGRGTGVMGKGVGVREGDEKVRGWIGYGGKGEEEGIGGGDWRRGLEEGIEVGSDVGRRRRGKGEDKGIVAYWLIVMGGLKSKI